MRLQPRKIRPPDYKRSPLGVRGVSCAVSAFCQVCVVLVAPPFMCRPASDPEVQYLPCNRSQGIKDRNFLHNLALVNESHPVLTWQPDGPFPFLFGVLSTKKERLMISYRGFFFLIMISLRSKRFLARLETLATQAKLWYALSTISKLEGLCTLYRHSIHSRPQSPSLVGYKLSRVALGTRMHSMLKCKGPQTNVPKNVGS